MKTHPPVLNSIITALHTILKDNLYSDKVLEYMFKTNKKLGQRDRRLIAETVYTIIRYYYLYEHLTSSKDIAQIVQYYFEHTNKPSPLTNLPDRILLSYNQELWDEACHSLGKEKWLREATALNTLAPLVIRTNRLKISKKVLQTELQKIGIDTKESDECDDALIITNKKFLSQTDLFKNGCYEFQDLSSQKASLFIPEDILQNTKRIIDACAGAGGKTLHLAALKQNKGQIIALDTDEKKLQELYRRQKRAGCSNIQIKPIHSSKTIKRLSHSADILILDVPCSGTGVIKRNPDTKLKFTKKHLNALLQIQKEILYNYSEMLKKNGHLLYITCSILPKENEEQVQWFLSEQTAFRLLKQKTIYPSEGFDGFYFALLKKE